MGSSCCFLCSHGNTPRAFFVSGKRLPVGKRYLPMGKRASITTTKIWKSSYEPVNTCHLPGAGCSRPG